MNAGDTAFILLCAAFVFIMTPGLAFFYGGMVRRKNVGNTMMQCVFIMGVSVIMWVLVGYALSFGGNHAGIIGGAKWFGFNGVGMKPGPYADTIPNLAFAAFQMMFAMITPALITGSLVGRMKFKALFLFVAIWSVIVYYPMTHMVWGDGGFLAAIGSVDFAGGDVVHISSGISALVLAIILGRRRGYEHTTYRIHNIPSVVLGASLLCRRHAALSLYLSALPQARKRAAAGAGVHPHGLYHEQTLKRSIDSSLPIVPSPLCTSGRRGDFSLPSLCFFATFRCFCDN